MRQIMKIATVALILVLLGAMIGLAFLLHTPSTEVGANPESDMERVRVSDGDEVSGFRILGPRRRLLRKGNAFAITMAEEALPAGKLPRMVEGHPRLLVRKTAWKYGLSLEQLRQRARTEPWAKQMAIDIRKPPDHPSSASVITHRALLYLITGDESLVPRIIERVLMAKPSYNVGGGLLATALWYDWIYNSPSVSDGQRRAMADKIAEVALECARIYESGHAFDIWTHRGSPGWAADVLAAGLVLDDHPEAEKLRSWGMGYFKRNYFRAWQHNDGAWMHGGSSYNIGMIMPQIIAYWASAIEGEDIYEVIRGEYGDWLHGHLRYMMAEVLPDKTRSEAVAWDYNPKGLRIKGKDLYWAVARAYGDTDFYRFQRWLGEDPKSGPYGRLIRILFYDEAIDPKEAKDPPEGSFTRLWGRHGPGYVQMRDKGWAPDGTVIEFKSGDNIWTHTHVNHNNAFWIFSKGRLAVQGGSYGLDKCFHGGTGSHYFTQSISTNTMLIFQPGEFAHAGGSRAGDLVGPNMIANAGGQRMRWSYGQTCFTFDEYLRRKVEESNVEAGLFETGDITAFESAGDHGYSYVSGDATMAYNNPTYAYWQREGKSGKIHENKPKIDLFTRSMVYLPKSNNLVVFDRVNALDPSWRKAWLCHFQGKPEISGGKVLSAEVPGHIEDFGGGIVSATWGDGVLKPPDPDDPGRLFIQTLLPRKHVIRRIGGDGYEAWVNGKNRTGDDKKILDKVDAGRWRIEVSPVEPRKSDIFLHLLHIGDTRTARMPPAEVVESEDGKMSGLSTGGWVVLFGKTGPVSGGVAYRAPGGRAENLLVDMQKGAAYNVTGAEGGTRRMIASAEGTLRLVSTGPASVRISPVP